MKREILEQEENLATDAIVTPTDNQEENSPKSDATPDPREKRHAEQLEWSRKEVEKWQTIAKETAYNAAAIDIGTLKVLHATNPSLAKEVAEKFDWNGSDWWTYTNFLSWKAPEKNSRLSEEDLERMLEEREAKKEHQKATALIKDSISKLDEYLQPLVQEYMDDLTDGKQLTEKQATKFLDMATLYADRGSKKTDVKEEAKAMLASTKTTSNKSSGKEEMVTIIKDGKVLLVPNTFK